MKHVSNNPIILLVGKSGSGKNYLVNKMKWDPIISYTTRPIRKGEQEGVEHYFVNNEFYETIKDTRDIVAYSFYNGYHYWAVESQYNNNLHQVYIVDVEGVKQIATWRVQRLSKTTRNYVIFYLNVPLLKRIKNMKQRGDSWRSIFKRLRYDFLAFASVRKFFDVELKWNILHER